jgi:hypothetical protein
MLLKVSVPQDGSGHCFTQQLVRHFNPSHRRPREGRGSVYCDHEKELNNLFLTNLFRKKRQKNLFRGCFKLFLDVMVCHCVLHFKVQFLLDYAAVASACIKCQEQQDQFEHGFQADLIIFQYIFVSCHFCATSVRNLNRNNCGSSKSIIQVLVYIINVKFHCISISSIGHNSVTKLRYFPLFKSCRYF